MTRPSRPAPRLVAALLAATSLAAFAQCPAHVPVEGAPPSTQCGCVIASAGIG